MPFFYQGTRVLRKHKFVFCAFFDARRAQPWATLRANYK
jgi:hypothetical protein